MNDKVFVSSTCYDLIDLRSELKFFMKSLGLTPIMSDHLDTEFKTFTDKNSIQTCLINLGDCDVVILILSQRYGPSLKDYGFDDYSATHLEYLKAIELKKKIIVFVRDRLEADYITYSKTKKITDLSWIKTEENVRLFEIIEKHKQLSNNDKNNWYWTFRNSIELKERLRIDLKNEINSKRLDELIKSGNSPLLVITASGHEIPNSKNIFIQLQIENMGNQAAIEPFAVIFKANNYRNIVEHNMEGFSLNYELMRFKSLGAGEKCEVVNFEFNISDEERNQRKSRAVIELVYKTIFGDLISDVSEIDITIGVTNHIQFFCVYTTKRYRSGSAFDKMVVNKV